MAGNFAPAQNSMEIAHQGHPFSLLFAQQILTGDGAITLESGIVMLTKATPAAVTIAPPDRDGQFLWIVTTTAQAHVVTQSTVGFNAKGASGTATWAAAIGNGLLLVSYNGNWYAGAFGVTIA